MSVPFFAKALYDYEAVESSELSVVAGDFLTVEEVNESGWCLARKDDKNGWLPTEYVERVESEVGAVPEPIVVSKPHATREIVATETRPGDQRDADALKSAQSGMDALALAGVSVGSAAPQQAPAAGQPSGKTCHACGEAIKSAFVMAKDKPFHPNHFQCYTCKKELGGHAYLEKDDKFYCEEDYYAAFNPKCGACNEVIKGPYVSALDQHWHPEHFCCTSCSQPFVGNQFRKNEGKPYCESCFGKSFAPHCKKCNKVIDGPVFEAMDSKYHLECFTCCVDDKPIGEGINFHVHEGAIYCPQHFEEKFLHKCNGCKEIIRGQYIKVLDSYFHSEGCWKCTTCSLALKSDNCAVEGGQFYCKPCAVKARHTQPVLQQMGDNPQAAPALAQQSQPSASSVFNAEQAAKRADAALEIIRLKQQAEADAAAAAKEKPVYADPANKTYTYAQLKDKDAKPADVDPAKKEQYLSNDEFQSLFKTDKASFLKLAQWKQKAAKDPLGLF